MFIEGRIRSRQWTDEHNQTRYNIEIAADAMTMLGPNQQGHTREEDQQGRPGRVRDEDHRKGRDHANGKFRSAPDSPSFAAPEDDFEGEEQI